MSTLEGFHYAYTPKCFEVLPPNAVAPPRQRPPRLGQVRTLDGRQVQELTDGILVLVKLGDRLVGPKEFMGLGRAGRLVETEPSLAESVLVSQ